MLACAEYDSAQANTARSRIFCEYIRKNEFLSKTILVCFVRGPDGFYSWNKKIAKNLVTLPLDMIHNKGDLKWCGGAMEARQSAEAET